MFQVLALLSAFKITESQLHSVFQEFSYKFVYLILY
jgi:hypothetical protein